MDAAPVLEFAEHVLDPVGLSVERSVVRNGNFAVGFRGDAGVDAPGGKGAPQPVRILARSEQCRARRQVETWHSRQPVMVEILTSEKVSFLTQR